MIDYSIIIPHKDVPDQLLRLLATCPATADTEVIVADDHSSQGTLQRLEAADMAENVRLVHVGDQTKGAGAARNAGLRAAQGKWLIFADADDFFLPDMKSIIDQHNDAEADLIYFHTTSLNTTTHEPSKRHLRYNNMIDKAATEGSTEAMDALKYGFTPPWAKMVKRDYIVERSILYDEVKASNDIMFSILAAHYAKRILLDPHEIYCITENTLGLTQTYSKEAWYARFGVALRANKFLREQGKGKYQYIALPMKSFKLSQYGFKDVCHVAGQLIAYRQNPFVGFYAKYKEHGSVKGIFRRVQ